jgi:hypothetical protein
MARSRNIKPGFFLNEDLAECSCYSRLLFIGLWCLADREGRLEDRPKRIKAAIFPYEDVDVDSLLNELESWSFLVRYTADGKRFIQINNFLKHQNPHYKEVASEIPPPQENSNVDSTSSQSQVNVDSTLSQTQAKLDSTSCRPCTLIPDSLNLIPDSGFLIADSGLPRNHGGCSTKGNEQDEIIEKPCEEQDITEQEKKILSVLQNVKNYPYDKPTDIECIRSLAADYPDVDLLQELKHWATWVLDKPLVKGKSKPRSQIRNWVRKAREFRENKTNRNRNGPVDRRKMSFEDYMQEAMTYAPE